MSLNLITGMFQTKTIKGVMVIGLLLNFLDVFSQDTNIDTPNLSFEEGEPTHWELYTGGIYLDNTDSMYKYTAWTPWTKNRTIREAKLQEFEVMTNMSDVDDPVINCWNFKTNPDGITPIRIGSTGTAENNDHSGTPNLPAKAERLVYKFTVTENTTLFTYCFASVLHCPDLQSGQTGGITFGRQGGQSNSDHTDGYQLPSFSVSVSMFNPATGGEVKLPCGEFTVNAEGQNADGLELVADQSVTSCRGSDDGGNISQYAFRRWTYGNFDLSKHVGKEVTIEVIVHDCLRSSNGVIGPGGHRAYGYFWAETKKLELKVKDCIGEPARIMAPIGFGKYDWSRSDGVRVDTDPNDPSVAVIPNDLKSTGVDYICKLTSMQSGCTQVELKTQLQKMDAVLDFEYENDCGGMVHFKNITYNIIGDRPSGYLWDFGDGSAPQNVETPDARYMAPGPYTVNLTVKTELGCSVPFSKDIYVRHFPNLSISSQKTVCIGHEVELETVGASANSRYVWSTNPTDTSTSSSLKTVISSYENDFHVDVIDEYFCKYEKDWKVYGVESPRLAITGEKEVCLGDTAHLEVRDYLFPDSTINYTWISMGVNSDLLRACPLTDTTYTVRGTYAYGPRCFSEASYKVNVLPLPVLNVDGDRQVCKNDPANLTAELVSYNGDFASCIWEDQVTVGEKRAVYPDDETTYSVYCVDEMNCKSRPVSITVKVKPLPDIRITGDSAICEGKSAKLTVNGVGTNVEWYDGTSGQTTITRSPTQDTTYWVEGYSNGCKGRADFNVKILDVPTVWIEGVSSICRGDSTNLIARGADTYVWNTSDNVDSIWVSPYSESEYSVIGTVNNGGCVGTASFKVSVNEPPTLVLSGNSDACDGDEAKVSVTGANEYFWSNNAYGPNVSVRVTKDDTLTVRGVDNNQCEATATWTIKKKELPQLSYSGDTAVCAGDILTITASGANTYEWQDGSGTSVFSQVLERDMELKVKGVINGCSSSIIIPVSVSPVPSLWVSGSGVTGVCAGDPAVLIGHGADRYQWSNGETTDTIVIYPTNSTDYSLYGYSEKGCEVFVPVPVKVNPNPMVYTTGDTKACLESVVTIEAMDSNGETASFSWDNGSLGSVITPKIMGDQTFTVTAQNKYGCKGQATHTVYLTEQPVLSFLGETSICYGETTTLQGQGAVNYTWTDGEKEYVGSSINVSPKENTLIRMTGSNVGNCPATIDIQLTVLSLPSILITGDSAVCFGDEFTLYASGASTYKWSTGDETSSIKYNTGSSAEYTVWGTNESGCVSQATHVVEVRPNPVILIEKGSQTGCQGRPDTIRFSAKGGVMYKWSSEPYSASVAKNGITSDLVATIEEPVVLNVEGTDEFGCKGHAEYSVELLPRQDIRFEVYPTFIESGSSNVRFSGISPKESKWYWEPDDGDKVYEGVNTSHFFDPNAADSFVVKVRAIDKYGCEYVGRQAIFTWLDFWAPEGFTPNGDDMNDSFKFFGGEYMDKFEYIIFNRVGEIVFEGKSIEDEWDGTVNGEPCPWGVYGWYCKYKSNYMGIDKEGDRRGFVSLVR